MKKTHVGISPRFSILALLALASVAAGALDAPPATAHHVGPSPSHGQVRGIVSNVPGGSVTLPLAVGSPPIDLTLALGGPAGILLPFRITSDTSVGQEDPDEGGAITLRNGDGVTADAKLVNGVIVATELTIEEFVEALPQGFVVQLPPGVSAVTVPLPAGTPDVQVVLRLGDGSDAGGNPLLPIVITPNTSVIGGGSLQIQVSDFVEAKVVFENGELRAHKIGFP
jgi:hypothetical protein